MSKGLEAIRQYKQFTCEYCQYHAGNECTNEDECFSMIIEKELKALEIIKNKKVDIKYLYYRAEFNLEKYNDNYIETLTQEECDLLKEVLL